MAVKYKRILLKLSGESLAGKQGSGFDAVVLQSFAEDIMEVNEQGVQVAIVLGGGNIFRGLKGNNTGVGRLQGDYMGMLATVINSLALQAVLQEKGMKVKVLSGIEIEPLAERMSGMRAIEYLNKGNIVIIAGGTGNPFFTTDSAAALRAIEVQADVLLKGTRVNGVYSADPEKHPDAVKYDHLTFDEAYKKNLAIMDMTAFTLCKENKMALVVYNAERKGNLLKIIEGHEIGTLVTV